MTGRAQLHQALAAALPGWLIVSDSRAIDGLRAAGNIVLWSARVARPEKLGLDVLQNELTLWVLTGLDDPTKTEDNLDHLLTQVFEALEPLAAFSWSEAERGVLAEKFDGWRIPITSLTTITTEE